VALITRRSRETALTQFHGAAAEARRLELGLRREHVALAINRSASSVFLYERGDVDPPASVVAMLADVLDLKVGDLFRTEAA